MEQQINLYELYNTEAEQVEGQSEMTSAEAKQRNDLLRANNEPSRWVIVPTDSARIIKGY